MKTAEGTCGRGCRGGRRAGRWGWGWQARVRVEGRGSRLKGDDDDDGLELESGRAAERERERDREWTKASSRSVGSGGRGHWVWARERAWVRAWEREGGTARSRREAGRSRVGAGWEQAGARVRGARLVER
jgi:hypothetical protein